MRPLRIEISGLRSFRAARELSFEGLNLFAIVGKTGAGKSSILEAMIYALFNASSWDERNVKELISQDCETMKVEFDFIVAGKRYRVTRSTSRIARAPIHSLRCLDDDEVRFDNAESVNQAIRKLIGLDYKTFTKAVIIPQGRFAELLKASTAERNRALTDLLGLDRINDLREALAQPKQEALVRFLDLKAQRAQLPADPRESASTVARTKAAMEQISARLKALREQISDSQKQLQRITNQLALSQQVIDSARTMKSVGDRLRELHALEKTAAKEISDQESLNKKTQERASAASVELNRLLKEKMDAASIASYMQMLNRIEAETSAVDADSRLIDAKIASEKEITKDVARLEVQVRSLKAKHASAERLFRKASAQVETSENNGKAAKSAFENYRRAVTDLESARKLLSARKSEDKKAEQVIRDATRETAAAEALFKEAAGRLSELERANHAHAAAKGLRAGHPCPVCKRDLPKGFKPPESSGLAKLQAAKDQADGARMKAHAALSSGQTAKKRATRDLKEAAESLNRAEALVSTAKAACTILKLDISGGTEESALGPMREMHRKYKVEQNLRDGERSDAKTNLDIAGATLQARESELIRLHADRVDAEKRLGSRKAELEQLRKSIKQEFLPQPDSGKPEYNIVRGRLDKAARAAADLARARDEALAVSAEIQHGLRKAEQDYRAKIEEPRSLCVRDLLHAATICASRAGAVKSEQPHDRPHESSIADDVAWSLKWASWGEKLSVQIRKEIADLQAEATSRDASIRATLEGEACNTVEEFDSKVVDAYAELKSLVKSLSEALSDAKRAEELDVLIKGTQPLHEALEKLHEYLQDRNFKEYLMRVRESTLLGIGTEILRKISRERYAFGHGFQIVDSQSGAMRSPRSLSGGETFLASLALSLALVEVASRSGGVLEALFLDEGFSGLDQGLSDDAFVELAQRASSGKLIGVITHLSGIAEHIDTIIRVKAEPNGSTIQLLQGSELATYMDDEMENELLPAMVTT